MHICSQHCSGSSESVKEICFSSRYPLEQRAGLANRLWHGQSHLCCSADLPEVHPKGGARAGAPSHLYIHGRAVCFCFRIKRYLSAHLDPFLLSPRQQEFRDVWLAQLPGAAVNSAGTQVLEHMPLLLKRPRPDNESKWTLISWYGSKVLIGWQGWWFAKAGKEREGRKRSVRSHPRRGGDAT